jgi:hypothetical protein
MAFVTGYWHSPGMNWLDGEVCGTEPEHCNMNPAYIAIGGYSGGSGALCRQIPDKTSEMCWSEFGA